MASVKLVSTLAVFEPRGRCPQFREGGPAAHRRLEDPRPRSKAKRPMRSPPSTPAQASESMRGDSVIDLRQSRDLLAHEVAVVEREDDALVALGAHLLADEPAMACRPLPVDAARIHAAGKVPELMELRALADERVRLVP